MTSHVCLAYGCGILVQPRYLACARHWAMLPRLQQERLWATLRHGPGMERLPTLEHHDAVRVAQATISQRERAVRETGGDLKPLRGIRLGGRIGKLWKQPVQTSALTSKGGA